MNVFFDENRRPFILGPNMKWEYEPNFFLSELQIDGQTQSPLTWRTYAYQIADWLSFCHRIKVPWQRISELDIAVYRNILTSEPSEITKQPLRAVTANLKMIVITKFYKLSVKKGWIESLPFEAEDVRIPNNAFAHEVFARKTAAPGDRLRLKVSNEEIVIPPRNDVRRFVRSFQVWRDQLIAEVIWSAGLRSAEVCSLPLAALPRDPLSIDRDEVYVRILGKGGKWRYVPFSVRLLRSMDRYIHSERRAVSGCQTVFTGRSTGKLLRPSAINRIFSTNCKRSSTYAPLHIWPHLLRHAFATERLLYLEEKYSTSVALRQLQQELGHAWLSSTELYLHLAERMSGQVARDYNSFVDRLLGE